VSYLILNSKKLDVRGKPLKYSGRVSTVESNYLGYRINYIKGIKSG